MRRPLTPLEARALGVLVEKQHTVPDSYPLSLNALTLGCNQKTARDPVINATEAEVMGAIEGLKEQHLLIEVSGSRVVRFEHNMARGLGVPGQSVALLTLLMLRGPQTSAELRLNTERLHRFADVSSVEGFLEELAEKPPAKVVKLPRSPGEREQRWAHLLCGEPIVPVRSMAASASSSLPPELAVSAGEVGALRAEVTALRREVDQLRAQVLRIATELGLPPLDES